MDIQSETVNINPIKRNETLRFGAVSKAKSQSTRSAPEEGVIDGILRNDLVDKLRAMPDVRPEVVELGRRLANSPDYPPDELVEKLAQVITSLPEELEDEALQA